MTTEHTPTPIHGRGFDPIGGGFNSIIIGEKTYSKEYVIRAVNSHDALVKALEATIERLNTVWRKEDQPVLDQAEEALRLAHAVNA